MCKHRGRFRVRVRGDRLQLVSGAPPDCRPPLKVPGFVIHRDSFVRCQTTTSTYAKCREYHSLTGDTKLYWQYGRQKGWLKPWKITIVPDDERGLTIELLQQVLGYCRFWRFLTIELAFDFSPSKAMNHRFIQRHALFGKSRRRQGGKSVHVLYYGGRKCGKLVRCYRKKAVAAYRVELELHSGLLRRHSISTLDDFIYLPDIVLSKHLRFVNFGWAAFERYLYKRLGREEASLLMDRARTRAISIRRLQRYLRRHGVPNPHRFLVSHWINVVVRRAFDSWVREFFRR
jgi:hypothetical protein